MASKPYRDSVDTEEDGSIPLQNTRRTSTDPVNRASLDSSGSDSTTSLILERLNPGDGVDGETSGRGGGRYDGADKDEEYDVEDEGSGFSKRNKPMEKKVRKMIWLIGFLMVAAWVIALGVYILREYTKTHKEEPPHDPAATKTAKAGKKLEIGQVLGGYFSPTHHRIQWIKAADGKSDGFMVEEGSTEGFLVVKNIENKTDIEVLMESSTFRGNGKALSAAKTWPSPDLRRVLILTDMESNFRHSFFGKYWVYDVEQKQASPLWPTNANARVALAKWSPSSDSIVFVFENNLYLRELPGNGVVQITKDGGADLFYGVPDWVYEEEVFSGNSVLWWSEDSKYLAFLRTNESEVPDYTVQYFLSRPSGERPTKGLENYPENKKIKYPKAGAPNPVVDIQFYDVAKNQIFSVNIDNDFTDLDRLITEVVWAGDGKVLVKETNRESDVMKMILVDVNKRKGKIVREVDIKAIDGGWFEVTEKSTYIPADPGKGRAEAGYIDTIVHDGNDHLGYFTPLDNDKPILLTKGDWEVVDGPSAVDIDEGLVYFISTERSPIERHIYSVKLDGSDKKAITNTSSDGRYDASFSTGGGYALISYDGPGIPYQKVLGLRSSSKYSEVIETNSQLSVMVNQYELPTLHYQTIEVDGFKLQTLERRPPHFNPKLKYPVLFQVYGGPGSQQVTKGFKVDFQSYVAGTLNYIVVTVDGRGTGYTGRKSRAIIRDHLGKYESKDQIEAAKIWAGKKYVDEKKIAIWGWSYGGFMTLKTLEQDAGQTFSYGMAVAPVTDWAFYDSIYTERYMHTPQNNPDGYMQTAITNATALGQNVRFLMMHGSADDNVHFQNSLTLLDRLDLAGVENYDVHIFPDSDHSIYFHNANKMVYDRLASWLITAFNGHFYLLDKEKPMPLEKQISDKL